MTSIVVLIISIFTIIAVTGEAVDLQTDKNLTEVTSEMEGCPYLDNAEYKVTVKGSVSTLNGGCGFINYNSSDINPQTFSLWFGNRYHTAKNCRDNAIEYFRFYCLSKSPSPSEDIRKGLMYIKLYDDAFHKVERRNRRCAVYDKTDGNDYVTTLRVAVSSNDSCDGLFDILEHPEKIRLHKKGAMLLIFSRIRPDAPLTPAATTTTTESIQSIYNQYERRGYSLQNYDNQPYLFWKTKATEIQDSDKREQQMSDADSGHSAVTDLEGYEYLHSDIEDEDVDVSTIKDTNHMQALEVVGEKK
ncbi:uncharacterized protein LOC100576025 [Acyrthosiphon pisum]|uniref:Secreted protein n=1 Tax=Acyrthosiphon pisum TaxID=7029 RepID=A0A8R1W7K0_ACYPI|nr:uncharacterized protein LOC100576025 [Acyrthosiphon pisum]|eukprot:XP_003241395.1 PREDICTED: uncharacterized protein LOC100576025 [Acyrthosiphon pisum]